MTDNQPANQNSDQLPNWVCIPDEAVSHLTTYMRDEDGFGGCPEHAIAGGCSIPQEQLQALIDQAVLAGRIDELERTSDCYTKRDDGLEVFKHLRIRELWQQKAELNKLTSEGK